MDEDDNVKSGLKGLKRLHSCLAVKGLTFQVLMWFYQGSKISVYHYKVSTEPLKEHMVEKMKSNGAHEQW